jgi:hypothetical protein
MKRSKSQALYNYSQDNTFDHSENEIIGKVGQVNGDLLDNLPTVYIIKRIKPYLKLWSNKPDMRPGNTKFIDPDHIKFDIFPKVFRCEECNNVTQVEDFEEFYGDLSCDYCDRNLRGKHQIPLVTVCKCGNISSLDVPSCSNCGSGNLAFIQKGSSLTEAKWRCSECGNEEGDVVAFNCSYCGKNKSLKVHSSSTCYYAQSEDFVNIEEGLDRLLRSSDYQVSKILDYLVGSVPKSDSAEEEFDKELESILEEIDDPELNSELNKATEKIKEGKSRANERKKEKRDNKRNWVESFPDSKKQLLSKELHEYNSVSGEGGEYSKTLEDIYEDAEENLDLQMEEKRRYEEKTEDLNMSSLKVMEDFPITSVVYGYTRLESNPPEEDEDKDPVDLNKFTASDGSEKLMVSQRETEAIMVSLDKEKVIDWLLENEVIDKRPEQDLKEWYLEQLTDYPHYDEISQERAVARHVLSLLHSYSHVFINSIGTLSGYSKESLVEYVMPHTLTFVVYKRSETDFNLGAMFSLIEERFLEFAEDFEDSDTCVYDPICENEENASCEGCLFVSNMSCINGNKNLSRSTLFGGKFDGENIEGFLNV